MIVICEECGKKYRIDPDAIKGQRARFKCRTCGHSVLVEKTPPVDDDLSTGSHDASAGQASETRTEAGPEKPADTSHEAPVAPPP